MAFPARGGSIGGGFRGRGRGAPRSRGRGRGRGRGRPAGERNHGFKQTRDWSSGEQFGPYKPKISIEDDVQAPDETLSDVEEAQDDTFDLASAAPMAYSALLTLMKPDIQVDEKSRKRKRSEHSREEPAAESDEDLKVKEDDEVEQFEVSELSVLEAEDQVKADDPFETHFDHPATEVLANLCQIVNDGHWQTEVSSNGSGKSITQYVTTDSKSTIDSADPATWHLKQRLRARADSKVATLATNDFLQQFHSNLYDYRDLSYCASHYKQTKQIRSLYCIHALNHIFKTRDRILKNNAKLSANPDSEAEYRDQGFTRPKVLILLPTRNACLEVVNELIAISGAEQVENRKKFQEQFGTEGIDPLKNANKPEDFKVSFAGNTDDAFRIGIKFTRKTIKLFAQFYGSDIIIASPLGLRMAIGDASSKKRDWDYLSSIELALVDGADAMAMQNWEHVEYCFEFLNVLPKEAHGCDYGRVRNWSLDEQASYVRQSVFISAYEFPELKSLYAGTRNVAGKVHIKTKFDGTIQDVGIVIRQTFSRFDSASPAGDPDARFEYFKGTTLPRLRKLAQTTEEPGHGTLLFVPSYFDFVRVRNHLTSLDMSFEALSEYSSTSDLTRGRHLFAAGRTPILLMTERLHHYRRYEIKGIQHIFFYQLPEHAQYFAELVRCAVEPGQSESTGDVRIAFSKWDALRLERVVGTKRVGKMLGGKDVTFEFM